MLTIRLRRMGKKNKAFYRLVVSDSRRAPTASAVEEVGHYDPEPTPPIIRLDQERIDYWVDNGATLSNTVRSLVKRSRTVEGAGVVEGAETADNAEAVEGAESA